MTGSASVIDVAQRAGVSLRSSTTVRTFGIASWTTSPTGLDRDRRGYRSPCRSWTSEPRLWHAGETNWIPVDALDPWWAHPRRRAPSRLRREGGEPVVGTGKTLAGTLSHPLPAPEVPQEIVGRAVSPMAPREFSPMRLSPR